MNRLKCFLILVGLTTLSAHAAVTVEVRQVGSDVVASATGSLDTTTAVSSGTATVISLFEYVADDNYAYIVGQGGGNSAKVIGINFLSDAPLNTAAVSALPDSNTGGPVGVDNAGGPVRLYVPVGYNSGDPINSSSTWENASLQDLGLTPGTYVFAYDVDNITFEVVGFAVGGTIAGLNGSLTLQNNNGDDVTLTADGAFVFPATYLDGIAYSVTVASQPSGQTCTVGNGSGSIAGADVSDVTVDCVDDTPPTVPDGAVPVPVNLPLALVILALSMMVLGGAALRPPR